MKKTRCLAWLLLAVMVFSLFPTAAFAGETDGHDHDHGEEPVAVSEPTPEVTEKPDEDSQPEPTAEPEPTQAPAEALASAPEITPVPVVLLDGENNAEPITLSAKKSSNTDSETYSADELSDAIARAGNLESSGYYSITITLAAGTYTLETEHTLQDCTLNLESGANLTMKEVCIFNGVTLNLESGANLTLEEGLNILGSVTITGGGSISCDGGNNCINTDINSTLTIGTSSAPFTGTIGCIYHQDGSLTIHGGTITRLELIGNAITTLNGGQYGEICLSWQSGALPWDEARERLGNKLISILGSSCAYADSSSDQIVNPKNAVVEQESVTLTSVQVVSHSAHDYKNGDTIGVCNCGVECEHGYNEEGICDTCGLSAAVQWKEESTDSACTYFPTLKAALDEKLNGGGYIRLLKDVEEDYLISTRVYGEIYLYLDLNGHDIDGTITVVNQDGAYYPVLCVTGSGTVTSLVVYGQKVELSGGTYGSLSVTGSSGMTKCSELLADGYCFVSSTNTSQTVAGDSYITSDVTVIEHEHTYANGVCSCGKQCAHGTMDGDGKCSVCQMPIQAKIGDTYYISLDAALSAAAASEDTPTVTLLADFSADNSEIILPEGQYTFDLNGHQVRSVMASATGMKLADSSGGEALIRGTVWMDAEGDYLFDLLPDGYAFFYSVSAVVVNAAGGFTTGVRIKAHDACIYKTELSQPINGMNYRCDCGRVSGWQDIAYISALDAEGKATVEYCRAYTRISEGDPIDLSAGWNVLSQSLSGQTMTLAEGSEAQLILCNGASFTAGELELSGSLTIYAQSLKAGEMGALTAKITQSAGTLTIAGGSVTLSEGSSFVKLVAANGETLVDMLPEECAYKAIDGDKIERSALGSELERVEVVKCTEHGYAYGVCKYCGYGCAHETVEEVNGVITCTCCKATMVARLTVYTTRDANNEPVKSDTGTTSYHATLSEAMVKAESAGMGGVYDGGAYNYDAVDDKIEILANDNSNVPTKLNISRMHELELNGYSVGEIQPPETTSGPGLIIKDSSEGKTGYVQSLTHSSGPLRLTGGTYGCITTRGDAMLYEFLAEGHMYQTAEGEAFSITEFWDAMIKAELEGNLEATDGTAALKNVKVVPEPAHDILDEDFTVTYSYTDPETGDEYSEPYVILPAGSCDRCGRQYAATVTSAEGVTTYYTALTNSLKTGALDIAQNGDTVTLLADFEATADIALSGNITLDLNGKELSAESGKKITVTGAVTVLGEKEGSQVVAALCVDNGGKLTIHSGAYSDVAVSSGGELVLRGGNYAKINGGTSVSGFLAEGYVYYDANGKAIDSSTLSETTKIEEVRVAACVHEWQNGACKHCGAEPSVKVTRAGENEPGYYATLSEALDAVKNCAAADEAVVTLLADVGGTEAIELGRAGATYALDGGSYKISAPVTVSVGAVKLVGGSFASIQTKGGMTVGDLFAGGYGVKKTGGGWYDSTSTETALTDATVTALPITGVTVTADKTAYTYGDNITLTAAPEGATEWFEIVEQGAVDLNNNSSTLVQTNPSAGSHTYRVTVTVDGYSVSRDITVTVNKKEITASMVAVDDIGRTYDGEEKSPTVTVTGLTPNTDYTLSGDTEKTNAGTYSITVSGKGNYTGTVTKNWAIAPATLTATVTAENKTYDGSATARVTGVTFAGLIADDELAEGTDYTVSAAFADKNVGDGKTVTATVTLKTGNYRFAEGQKTATVQTMASINKAAIAPTLTMSGYAYGAAPGVPAVTGNTDNATVTYYYSRTNSTEGGTLWDTKNPPALDAGTYYLYATVAETANCNGATTAAVAFTVAKATPSVAVTMGDYTYGETPSVPAVTGNTDNAAVTYYYSRTNSTEGGTLWDTKNPPALDAGTYYLYATVAETANCNSAKSAAVAFTVRPAGVAALVTDPQGAGNQTYDATAKTLVTAGSLDERCGAHTFYYRLVKLDGEAETTVADWTSDAAAIKATDAGSYRIDWYCHVESDNYADLGSKEQPSFVSTRILPRSIESAAITQGDALSYTGAQQTQTLAAVTVSVGGQTLALVEGTDYTLSGHKATDAGGYTLTVSGIGNYTGAQKADWVIEKAAAPETDDVETARKYDKTGEQTVSVKDRMPQGAKVTGYALGELPQGVTEASVDDDGTLRFAIDGLTAEDVGKTITIAVVVRSQNYQDATVNVVVTITKYTPVNNPVNGHAVKTGDEATPVLYLAVIVLALAAIVTVVIVKKKKQK